MKFIALFLLTVLNCFAWDPSDIKVMNCEYNGRDVEFSTSQKEFFFNRVYNDRQVKLMVKNTDKPSEIDDYISISDFKGHKVTYSLKCKRVNK